MANAVIRTGGKQYRVALGDQLRIPSLQGNPGDEVTFGDVLALMGDAPKVTLADLVGAKVTGKILAHGRDKKIVVFKFKKRKRYKRKAGHRQGFTQVEITGIDA